MSNEANAFYLGPFDPFLNDADTWDVCVNEPGVVHVYSSKGWLHHKVPALTASMIESFCNRVAHDQSLEFSDRFPFVTGSLPTGHRALIVGKSRAEHISLTIRRLSTAQWDVPTLAGSGSFSYLKSNTPLSQARRDSVIQAYEAARDAPSAENWHRFSAAVGTARVNVAFTGGTGSGKTTMAAAFMRDIPSHERIVTIEDTREIQLPSHANKVHMVYPRTQNERENEETVGKLLQAVTRMRPNRVCMMELRDREAFGYVMNTFASFPGSYTTFHTDRASDAVKRLAFLCMKSESGMAIGFDVLSKMIESSLDIVIQMREVLVNGKGRQVVEEVLFGSHWNYEASR